MRKMPLLFIIPMIGIFAAVGIAFAIRLSTSPSTPPAKAGDYPNPLTKTQQVSNPSSFLGGLLGGGNTPSPTPATAIDLSNELKATYDDGGKSELDAIAKDAASL